MANFLPKELAQKALPQIQQLLLERWQRSQDPTTPKRSPSKHKSSEYVLTGRLFAAQDGDDLVGTLSGKQGKAKRYYRHRRGRRGYIKGSVYNKLIPAQPLEEAVFQLIRHCLVDTPHLRERVIAAVRAQAPAADEQTLTELRQQRAALAKKVQLVVQTLDEASLADAEPELDRLGQQRRELDQQLAQHEQAQQYTDEDPEALADHVAARLGSLEKHLGDLPPALRRELIEAFVTRVEVDLETKNATVNLRIPPWALEKGDSAMCLANSSLSSTGYETHPPSGLVTPLAFANCHYTHKQGSTSVPPCYRCQRRKAA